jgi:pyruvate/2-oxoacid:ferredoxin oxidoreductase beta subunit
MKRCNKIRYATEKDALFALEKIKEQSVKQKKPIRVYKCYCGAWHLTSRKDLKDIAAENAELKNTINNLNQKIINIESEQEQKIKLELKRENRFKTYTDTIKRLEKKLREVRNDLWKQIAINVKLQDKIKEIESKK